MVGEPFFDWVIEDDFAAGRPDWSAGGARFVASAEPFETLKLRMVNCCHSTIAYLGVAAGWASVDRAIAEPASRRLVETMMRDEIGPTLPALPSLDLAAYRARLIERFANPALAHQTQQIAMDVSQKLAQRLAEADGAPDETGRVARLCAFEPVVGALGRDPRLIAAVARHTDALRTRGVRATLEALA